MNYPHILYYSEWAKEKFHIKPTFHSYEDSAGIVHEITSTMVPATIFGAPKSDHATITVRCGGGLSVPIARLSKTQAVSCWECLAR